MNWTVHAAAKEWHSTDETIVKGLRAAGIEVIPRKTYTTLEIFNALAGDLKYQRTRRERAEADRAELEVAHERGELIKADDVTRFIQRTFGPFRERLMGLPGRVTAALNLTGEQRKVLDAEIEATINFCREHIPTKKEINKP